MTAEKLHTPVLLEETIEGLNIKPDGIYVDATYGEGGHSAAIIEKLGKKGKLIAFDQDARAFEYKLNKKNFILIHSNFVYIPNFLKYLGIDKVDGIMADLGVSSAHLDMPERGFSYRFDAPLDMRMNTEQAFTAADVVNKYDAEELAGIFRQYGELRNARQLAQAIVRAREKQPLQTTAQLVEAVEKYFPPKLRNKLLSMLFQAIRIEVNNELENLKIFLDNGSKIIKQGGRFAIISFHSLEDRIVKNFFKTGTFDGKVEKDIYGNFYAPFRQIHKKVITPKPEETVNNPRARSAKLRIAERI